MSITGPVDDGDHVEEWWQKLQLSQWEWVTWDQGQWDLWHCTLDNHPAAPHYREDLSKDPSFLGCPWRYARWLSMAQYLLRVGSALKSSLERRQVCHPDLCFPVTAPRKIKYSNFLQKLRFMLAIKSWLGGDVMLLDGFVETWICSGDGLRAWQTTFSNPYNFQHFQQF